MDFHRGEVLWTLANTYPSVMLTLVEAAQNAIDADAERVLIGIDLKRHRVMVVDNGRGVSLEKFEQALASVGKGIKSRDRLGRFGRGLIAPVNKCRRFTFISKVAGSRPIRWTFSGVDIRAQHEQVTIPQETLREMPGVLKVFQPFLTNGFNVKWMTMVNLEGVTTDRVISLVDLDELESQIRTKLGMAMRRQNTSIRVVLVDEFGRASSRDINPVVFSGEQLGVVEYVDDDAGAIEVDLYRAQKLGGTRKGTVLVMEADGNYPLPMKEVARQMRGGRWTEFEDVIAILTSGFFEGMIRCEKIALSPTRTKFEFNDALLGLFMVLSTWYDQFGLKHYENEQERSRESRYQDLGLESQERLRELLPPRLWEVLKAIVSVGRLGDGHLDPERGRMGGFEDESSLRTGQGGAGTPKTSRDTQVPQERQREPRDRPGDMPTGSLGPDGSQRQLVKGDSLGLWYEYSPLFANFHLWEFNARMGILTFNTKHPVWVRLDETNGRHTTKNAKQIMDLQEWLTLQVLCLLQLYPDPEAFGEHRSFIDDQVRVYADLFILNKRR